MILPILALIVALRLTTAAPSLILQSSEGSFVDAFKALNAPEAPHGILNLSSYTILEILDASLGGGGKHDGEGLESLPLHRLAYLVNKSPEARSNLANAKSVTLLAPDNDALAPPPHKSAQDHPFHSMDQEDNNDPNRQARFQKIIAYILNYHTLDVEEDAYQLSDRSTVPTRLRSSRFDEEPLRVRVEPKLVFNPYPHPALQFNFYAYSRGPVVIAKNGIIHLISAPLLPPFTPLNDLFLLPQVYSTLTSGLQKVGLDSIVLPRAENLKYGEDALHDMSVVQEVMEELMGGIVDYTFFAPTSLAFDRLGFKTIAFLHSPFLISRRVLKYILSYHIVPNVSFFSDYSSNSTALAPYKIGQSFNLDSNITHYELPTLLSASGYNDNATLLVDVISYKSLGGKGPIKRDVIILPHTGEENDRKDSKVVAVWKADAPARHGAIHALNSVLIPPYHRQSHDLALVSALDQINV